MYDPEESMNKLGIVTAVLVGILVALLIIQVIDSLRFY